MQQLLAYTMNTAPLRTLLDRMVSNIVESQEQFHALSSLESTHFDLCSKQLASLPGLKSDVSELLSSVEAWEKTAVRDM